MLGGVGMLNVGSSSCVLDRFVGITVIGGDGSMLPVEQRWDEGSDRVALDPGEEAMVMVQWWSWCGPRPLGALSLQMHFARDDEPLTVPVLNKAGLPESTPPRCEVPDWPSSMRIGRLTTLRQ
jgi:hypothetical protein